MLATLTYEIDVGVQVPSTMVSRVAAIDVDEGTLGALGLTVASDSTVVDGARVKRTIVLETDAQGDSFWTSAEALKYATRNIFKQVFELRVPSLVTAAEPVVS